MESALVTLIKSDAAMSSLIGDRLWPGRIPEPVDISDGDNFPMCLYTNIYDTKMIEAPVDVVTIQFTVYSRSYSSGKEVKEALIDLLHRHRDGALRSAVYSSGIGPVKDTDLDLWQTTLDFRFKYMEEV